MIRAIGRMLGLAGPEKPAVPRMGMAVPMPEVPPPPPRPLLGYRIEVKSAQTVRGNKTFFIEAPDHTEAVRLALEKAKADYEYNDWLDQHEEPQFELGTTARHDREPFRVEADVASEPVRKSVRVMAYDKQEAIALAQKEFGGSMKRLHSVGPVGGVEGGT